MRRATVLLALLLCARALSAQEPDNSRAVFREAAAQPAGSARAIELYERYTRLEPEDAWGHLALAEALAAAGRIGDATRALAVAERLAPDEPDVAEVRKRIERARRARAPSLQPRLTWTRDSDANQQLQFAVAGDVATSATARFGASFAHATTDDGVDAFSANDTRLYFTSKTKATRLELSGGAARIEAFPNYTTAVGRARLRWNPTPNAAMLEVRAARTPVMASPLLVINQVVLSEARGMLELPLAGPLRLRAMGQLGSLESADIDTVTFQEIISGRGRSGRDQTIIRQTVASKHSRNTRIGYGGGLVVRASPITELSAQYYQLGYDEPASAGYYAPRLVRTAEVGTYAEIYRFDPATFAFDVGAGAQSSAEHDAPFGEWKPMFRGWALLTVPLSRVAELNVESEAYRSQLSTVATSGSWSSISAAFSVRWLISR